ncbi:uncharacterized protein LOC131860082 [Cryptomeria japonica]|uniref:uncharacterized protein LOC131860082 n=1 Tax=Cryptomeria japonica TaxID=3369 RepID=UPI0027DA4C06|nr:uncharacterized protein LOC131860082 [Cryptomeria japonica]
MVQQLVNVALSSQGDVSIHPLSHEVILEIIALQNDDTLSVVESKPGPFDISPFINGHKSNNCIIDLSASDNIIPSAVAKALGLSLTKTFEITFQRDMELSFGHLKDKIIIVYLDDLTVFSKRRKHHMRDLRQVLQRCREHGVSLNPKKSVFEVIEDFVEITSYIVHLMSGNEVFKWNEEGKKSYQSIEESIAQAPILVNPDFKKYFIIYFYASEHTMSGILLQKNEENEEVPIAFMSVPLKKHELKYWLMEKQAYVAVKAVKQFRYYIIHSHAGVYVSHSAVKRILTQQDIGINNKASWVSKISEFNLDIKPTKIVRGQGLCNLIVESKNEVTEELPLVLFVGLEDSWFADVSYLLTYGDCPKYLSPREKQNLRLKATKYVIFDDVLYKKGLDGTFLRLVDKSLQESMLKTFHDEACGGHFSSTVTTYKILRNSYYWLGMFKDAYAWVGKCEKCKLFTGKPQCATLPLKPIVIDEPFKKWG